MAGHRLGIDTGGTFTDLQLMDEATGAVIALKTPSTPDDPARAVAAGIEALRARHGIDTAAIHYFAHGTTLALNTLLERTGARVGVLMTRGFTDTLELRRLRLSRANDFFVPKPVSPVPRRRVRPIDERLRPDGRVRTAPRREDAEEQLRALLAEGIDTLAICFLHAHRNPAHERLVRDWIRESAPDLPVCASSDVWPQQREYERAAVTVANAYVAPRMTAYFERLERLCRRLAMPCRPLATKSNGGVMSLAAAAARPVETLLSGPASGVVAAHRLAALAGTENIVTFDMGGTSADMSVVEGALRSNGETAVGDVPIVVPAIDICALGAGGGSIARVDAEGVLKVGPRSAGASPGPACYGRGGREATVTDAWLVAGILAPAGLLGGEMALDQQAGGRAIDALAGPLGVARHRAADAVLQVAVAGIYAELLPQLARRGSGTDGLALFAYGAAGPTAAFMLAREAEIGRVIVPPAPGLLCALGCLLSDLRADFVASVWRETAALPADELRAIFARLEDEARAWLAEQKVALERVYLLRSADLCYVGQSFEVNVPFPELTDPGTELAPAAMVEWFHRRYAALYGYADAEAPVRMLEARLQIVGVAGGPRPGAAPRGGGRSAGPAGRRRVRENGEEREAAVWRRQDLRTGEAHEGPLIVEQYDSTAYVPAGFALTVDPQGNLVGERA